MLEMSDVEERAARCNMCSGELSIIENVLYGNRCVFCCEETKNIGLLEFLVLCFYDHRLWRVIERLIQLKGPDEARMLVLGSISECGGINMACMRTVKDKKALIKALKKGLHYYRGDKMNEREKESQCPTR